MVDPRIERTRAAVVAAATELLLDGGPSAVTVDAIVAASGVARSTFYRHWPTRDDLVVELFERLSPPIEPIDLHGGFEVAMRRVLLSAVALANDHDWGRMLPAMLMLRLRTPAIAALDARMRVGERVTMSELLRLGADEGLVRVGLDPDRVVQVLAGPVIFASMRGEKVDDELVDELLQRFLISEAALIQSVPVPSAMPSTRS